MTNLRRFIGYINLTIMNASDHDLEYTSRQLRSNIKKKKFSVKSVNESGNSVKPVEQSNITNATNFRETVFKGNDTIMSPSQDSCNEKLVTEPHNALPSVSSKLAKRRRKHLKLQYEPVEPSFEPLHWKEILQNIRSMRSARDAPVDSMGAEQWATHQVEPEVQRFHILVSLMLSSQTKDEVNHAAMKRLIDHGLTVDNVLGTKDDIIGQLIYPVGFWKKKIIYLKKTCEILRKNYNGDIPPSVETLCELPGVGPKMAHLCMDIAWGKLTGIGVDTHVHRISNRLGFTGFHPTNTPEKTRLALESWMPQDIWSETNLLMVGFGQQICLPLHPKCSKCLNQHLCPYEKNAPNKSPSKTSSKSDTKSKHSTIHI